MNWLQDSVDWARTGLALWMRRAADRLDGTRASRAGSPGVGDLSEGFAEVRAEERARVHASMLSFVDELESFAGELIAAGHGRSDACVALKAAAIKIRRAAVGERLDGQAT